MSAWDLWTWVAIAVLVLGAPLIFIWFLVDAVRLISGTGTDDDAGSG